MYTKYFIVCTLLISSAQNYGMSGLVSRAKANLSRAKAKIKAARPSQRTYKPTLDPRVPATVQEPDIILAQTREFHESSPKYRTSRAGIKAMIFSALTQSTLSYYNILAFTALPLPLSIFFGGALLSAPAIMFDASEILKRHWNYWKQKRAQNNDDAIILQKLLDRVTIASFSEKEPIFIQETDVPKKLVNKPILPGNETILQAALKKGLNLQNHISKEMFLLNIKTLVYAGADPNPSVPDEKHPITILLGNPNPDVETLALLINPLIIPVDTLKPLPHMVEQKIKEFIHSKKLALKDTTDEWSQTQIGMLNSIEKALGTRKTLLWEKEVTLKKQSQPLSPIDL